MRSQIGHIIDEECKAVFTEGTELYGKMRHPSNICTGRVRRSCQSHSGNEEKVGDADHGESQAWRTADAAKPAREAGYPRTCHERHASSDDVYGPTRGLRGRAAAIRGVGVQVVRFQGWAANAPSGLTLSARCSTTAR